MWLNKPCCMVTHTHTHTDLILIIHRFSVYKYTYSLNCIYVMVKLILLVISRKLNIICGLVQAQQKFGTRSLLHLNNKTLSFCFSSYTVNKCPFHSSFNAMCFAFFVLFVGDLLFKMCLKHRAEVLPSVLKNRRL